MPRITATSGFTLIELLIVVSILGILSTFVVFNYQSTNPKVRDSQRKSDLRQYATLLTQYASKNTGFYPQRRSGTTSSVLCVDLGKSNCPDDPSTTDGYFYISDGTLDTGVRGATKYVMTVELEYQKGVIWAVCSNGSSGEVPDEVAITASCPL